MLFNSYSFILIFLPLTLVGYWTIRNHAPARYARLWLLAASFVFYTMWQPGYTLILLASIGYNYYLSRQLHHARRTDSAYCRFILIIGIAFNLVVIAYFKYSAFIAMNVLMRSFEYFDALAVALPLGISFFTFQQIAYLVDVSKGKVKTSSLTEYALFVTFFPQLIAGPIVHHSEMMPQFKDMPSEGKTGRRLAHGLTFFIIGLFKKVVIADNISLFADRIFNAPSFDGMTAMQAWQGALAYSFQIYFDFSGYSDMAIGLALMFGIRLPYNFNSPYRAVSIVDFWRRWHITLSRFLRDYVYIPLGGNRQGKARRYLNLFLTMLLGGLWHGANWTFVIWGALHGVYLIVNHVWMALCKKLGLPEMKRWWAVMPAAGITFLAVTISWVFFRATSFGDALAILGAMGGGNGLGTPKPILLLLLAAWPVLYFLPNSQQLIDRVRSAETLVPVRWRPSLPWAGAFAVTFVFTMTQLSNVSAFLYFNF
ncbi:MBOAT family protein [Stakelama sediminis]|uniref:Probable alginate O-acetylase AlgI n=1 Tax=Stakelama sediminis TaxID=463200 RepID=A0A840YYX0_9SPHN|nr:MBOAT family protein [Stakelama sediminis]MBB5718706.1 D-alanyl-lipoteichoic acid acyltransferase DltB (MBOAT superfamily) [Stakelama sediminis]